jgi:ABC-type nickel/cobalt efflux system permease component RcnA
MVWLEFAAYFFIMLFIFWAIWKSLDKAFDAYEDRQYRQLQKGRELTKQDFIDFGFDEPIFLWPLKEDKDGHN